MIRKKNSIPYFIQSFGEKFFSYTLNIELSDAKKLLNNEFDISDKKNKVLDEIISTFRSFRIQEIDNNNIDYMVYHKLCNTMIKNETHILNYWRVQCEGKLPIIENTDNLVKTLQTIGIEVFPIFMLNKGKAEYFHQSINLSYLHKLGKELKRLVLKDNRLKLLFNSVGDSDTNTYCSYKTSTGKGGIVQLGTFIDLVLLNSYYLMVLNGQDDILSYLSKIEENINLLREIGKNNKATVPVYIGYSNISFLNNTSLTIPQGTLMSFDEKLLSILPLDSKPVITDGILSAIIYKGRHSYYADFQQEDSNPNWPNELKISWKKLNIIDEDLMLAINLACRRTPPVSISKQWTIIFDPLTHGLDILWYPDNKTPTPHYSFSEKDVSNLKYWCTKINETDDSKIRLAIRKLNSSISYRANPIDGFIDAIIVWENLFGANAELSFRISSAISCLLEKDKTKRKELQKKLKDKYNARSQIVHGVNEINHEKATGFRNFAINIGLDCLSELYQNYPELINKPDRSLTILLEHE